MKTVETGNTQQTTEPAVPFPNVTPRTEEIIIPSVNSYGDFQLHDQSEMYQKDDSYALIHKMIFDLLVLQNKVVNRHDIEDFNLAVKIENHIVEHVGREIRRGYVAETPLQLSEKAKEDDFTLHVAREYVKSQLSHMREFGPDTAVIDPDFVQLSLHSDYIEQSLFNSPEDLESTQYEDKGQFAHSYPAHVTAIPVEQLTTTEIGELNTFNAIVKKFGGKVAQVLGVSFHSGEIPITKIIPVVDKAE